MTYKIVEHYQATDLVELAIIDAGLNFTKHYQHNSKRQMVVNFRFTDYEFDSVDGLLPQITVINSTDKSRALHIMGGVFRLVCANGLIAGEIFDREKIIHIDGPTFERKYASLPQRIVALIENTIVAAQEFQDLANDTLTEDQMIEIAANITMSKVAKSETIKAIVFEDQRREADQGNNVWTLFNLINESMRKHSTASAYTANNMNLLQNIQLLAA